MVSSWANIIIDGKGPVCQRPKNRPPVERRSTRPRSQLIEKEALMELRRDQRFCAFSQCVLWSTLSESFGTIVNCQGVDAASSPTARSTLHTIDPAPSRACRGSPIRINRRRCVESVGENLGVGFITVVPPHRNVGPTPRTIKREQQA